ncbi:MAG: hypothetical protein R6U44_05385 [Archaeoglobaceae archaeon]
MEQRKGIVIVIVLALSLIVVASSFVFLNFGLYRSETVANQQVTSASTSEPEVELQNIYLHVVRGDPISNELEKGLKEELQQSGEVKSFINLKENFDGPVVAAKVLRTNIFYTPFYSQAEVDVLFFFSSTGNTTYFQKFVRAEFGGENVPVIFNSQQGPQLIVKGKINVKDTSYGVFSIKNYHSRLAEEITSRIDNNVEDISTKY